jgi:phosphoribosylanthranilate isomerase
LDDKYKKAIKLRLSYEIPVINTWAQAMNLGLEPQNITSTIDKLISTVDVLSALEDDAGKIKRYIILKTFIVSGIGNFI